MTILRLAAITLMLAFTISCNKSKVDVEKVANAPFDNGSTERNLIVVISDLHLGADIQYTETNKNLVHLEKFLENIRTSKNIKELIIAGDLLDEWFVPANVDTYNGKDQLDFVKRIATTNKGVFDAFNKIIKEGNIMVTYVPGNHDLAITAESVESILPGIKQARDSVLGLGTYSPASLPELAVEHGHRYNFFCAPDPISNKEIAPGSIMPPGYFFTRMGALHVVQKCKKSTDSIIKLTIDPKAEESQILAYKYWKSWVWSINYLPVNHKFNEKIFITNIDGFTETYSINDLLPYQKTPNGLINMKLYNNIQNTWEEREKINMVGVHIPVAHAIDSVGSSFETDNQAKVQYFLNPNSNKRLVVFGHSHQALIEASNNTKGEKCIYANSGTWIDRKDSGKSDPNQGKSTMNFVIITPQSNNAPSNTHVRLYNFMNGVVNLMQADSLRI